MVHQSTQLIIEYVNSIATPSHPMRVRQLYYAVVTNGILPSSTESYNKVKRIVADGRRSGVIPYESIRDSIRSAQKVPSWKNLADRAASAEYIHLDPWQNQNTVCEVLLEKDAALPLIESVCEDQDVTIRTLRGDSSLSFLYETAKEWSEHLKYGKSVRVGCWSDFDGGGISIMKSAESTIRDILQKEFYIDTPDCDMQWTRLGITKEQFEAYNMLPIPGKKNDTKLKAFIREFGVAHGAEIDALPEAAIQEITAEFIESCKDQEQWAADKADHAQQEGKWLKMLSRVSKSI